MTSIPNSLSGSPLCADDAAAVAEASAFLHDLEGFVLGFRSMGEILGWAPGEIDSLVALGDRLLAAGRIEDALTIFEGVLALDPRRVSTFCRLALCHHAGDDPTGASACLAAARACFGDLPELAELAEALRAPC